MVHDVKIPKAITFVGVKLDSMERTVEITSMIALQVQLFNCLLIIGLFSRADSQAADRGVYELIWLLSGLVTCGQLQKLSKFHRISKVCFRTI